MLPRWVYKVNTDVRYVYLFNKNPRMTSLCLHFCHLLAQKPNVEQFSIYSNKFVHNFHLSESSCTCPGSRASGLAWRLRIRSWGHETLKYEFCTQYNKKSSLSKRLRLLLHSDSIHCYKRHFIFLIQFSSWLFF